MRFGILGTLEVRDRERRPLDLGASKQQSLLAVLLLNANQVVSTDRLVDALWGEEPPETAQKALQVYVSQLRRVVGKEQLLTKPPGYLLQIDPEQLDLLRFEALIKEARKLDPKAQSAKLREALALWRGPPLAEFAYRQFAQAEIARLEEVHLACIEERIEADLACGRHTDLVGELEGLTKEHPVREHLRAQLMLSLYRSGRQAEALEVYQAARVDLVEHLGIEPGSVLRELELAILRQDPALELEVDGTASEPRQLLPPPAAPSPVAREVRKVVTVLFADLTPAGKLDPEQLRRVTSRAFEEMRHVFERHGASVEGLMGAP